MFSLQAPKCATFEEWHRKLQKSIEDLNLLYGAISWDHIYLAIVVWALELMEDKYRQLRQHMKFNLPGTTKALLENPIDTLDQIIRRVTKWDGTQVTPQMRNAMVRRREMGRNVRILHIVTELLEIPMIQQDMVNATAYSATSETICSYCKQKNHTIEMCVHKKFDRELKDKVAIIVPTLVENFETLNDLLQQKGRLSNDLEKIVRKTLKTFQGLTIGGIHMRDRTSRPPKNANEQTPQQGEEQPFSKTSHNTPRVHHGGQNGRMPGKDMTNKIPLKKLFDDKEGAPRANVVCDMEHVQAAKTYAEIQSRRLGKVNLYQADDDQEIQDDTGYHSYLAQYDHHYHDNHVQMNTIPTDTLVEKHSFGSHDKGMLEVVPMDPADIPVLTEDELEQAHDIFMLTVDRRYSEMKPVQEMTPGQELILTAEDIFGSPKPSETDLINTSMMTDDKLDESATENADCTPYLTWEEADQNDEQLQSEQCMEENLESCLNDAENDFIHPTLDDMAQCEHVIHNGTAWHEDCLTQLPETKIRIVMMDCGNGMEDLAKPEYSTVDQFQELSDMLGENAVCKLVTQHEYTNTNDFRQKLKDAQTLKQP